MSTSIPPDVLILAALVAVLLTASLALLHALRNG